MPEVEMRRQVETEILNTWESWEHIVNKRIVDLEYLLDQLRNEFSLCGLSFSNSDIWLDQKVQEMKMEIRQSKKGRRTKMRM